MASGGGSNGSTSKSYKVSDIITFGTYPQSEKAAGVTVNTGEYKNVGGNIYYKGSDGAWYANKASKYYKVEPIKWKIIDFNSSGEAFLPAEGILAISPFFQYYGSGTRNVDGIEIEPNEYFYSMVNAFLTGQIYYDENNNEKDDYDQRGFLQQAFTEAEQARISNWAGNKIFLPANSDVSSNSFFPYSSVTGAASLRQKTNSAYSGTDETLVGKWWLSSKYLDSAASGSTNNEAYFVNRDGFCDNHEFVHVPLGVVPALFLKL